MVFILVAGKHPKAINMAFVEQIMIRRPREEGGNWFLTIKYPGICGGLEDIDSGDEETINRRLLELVEQLNANEKKARLASELLIEEIKSSQKARQDIDELSRDFLQSLFSGFLKKEEKE